MMRAATCLLAAAIVSGIITTAIAQRGGRGRAQGFGRDQGSSARDMVNRKFDGIAPAIGESMPDITVHDDAGNPVALQELLEGHYSVVVLGCLT